LIVGVDDEADRGSKNVDKHHQKRTYVQSTKHIHKGNKDRKSRDRVADRQTGGQTDDSIMTIASYTHAGRPFKNPKCEPNFINDAKT